MSAHQFYRATLAQFQAQREEALAVLQLYFTNAVAVGDHPGIVNDLKEWTQKLACAEDAIATLTRNFMIEGPAVATQDPDPAGSVPASNS